LGISFRSVQSIIEEILSMSQSAPILCPAPPPLFYVCVNFWIEPKLLSLHTIPTHQILCHMTTLFQKPNMALNRKRFNDIITIQAKLWAPTASLKTMHFSTCLKQWHNFCTLLCSKDSTVKGTTLIRG
jgi:hypothetical protein